MTRITGVRFTPFVLLHLWRSLQAYVLGRLILTAALAFAKVPVAGGEFVMFMPLLTVALLHVDRRRAGARDLYANLGYGVRELLAAGAAVGFIAEAVLYIALRGSSLQP